MISEAGKRPKLLGAFLFVIVLLLSLVVTGVLNVNYEGSGFEAKTVPLVGVKSDGPYLEVISSETNREIKQVFVPTFTKTIKAKYVASESELKAITQKFVVKLSTIYNCNDLKLSPNQTMDIGSVIQSAEQLPHDRTFGVLIGSVNAFQDEIPSWNEKAIVSVTLILYDNSGKKVWVASQTMSGTTAKPGRYEGVYTGSRLQAIELVERLSTELVLRLKEMRQ
jgi:hypothetical protein